jgi:hypothetical protein
MARPMNVELLRRLRNRSLTLIAAIATFGLKAAEWFRLGRLFIAAPDSPTQPCSRQADDPPTAPSEIAEPLLFGQVLRDVR